MNPAGARLVELRSYTLVPGQAEAFVEHFERRFLVVVRLVDMQG